MDADMILEKLNIMKAPEILLDQAHFHESNGFYLKCDAEFPSSVKIKPTLEMGGVSVSIPRWSMETSEIARKLGNAFFASQWTKQPISLALVKPGRKAGSQDILEVLQFSHRNFSEPLSSSSSSSSLVCMRGHHHQQHNNKRISDKGNRNKTKLVDIFCPNKGELVGWIKYNHPNPQQPITSSTSMNLVEGEQENFGGWLLSDSISKSIFLTSSHRLPTDLKNTSLESAILAMQISTPEGFPVAILQAKRGLKQRKSGKVHWTDWKLHFSHSCSLTSSSKAVILVACIIWVLSYKEESARKRLLASIRQSSADIDY